MTTAPAGEPDALFEPLELPCGVVLKNRVAKSAMSDSLGDGRGDPTDRQIRLYERWASGGLGLSIVGEVQGDPRFAEKPGNLVLGPGSNMSRFAELARRGGANGTRLWLQLGHAGAMTHPPIGTPKGPSALDLPGLSCDALTRDEIRALPDRFARTAGLARELGFGGVQVHAAHGFLLSQFLSPLFNRRDDGYGGSIASRSRLLREVIAAVREAVGPGFPVAVKLNATDQLDGGLTSGDALEVVAALDGTGIDLLDISGGTYFPGAKSASDASGGEPYFLAFARRARERTGVPLMVTGGFKTHEQARSAITSGGADVVGLARALVLDPELPGKWRAGDHSDPAFPRFEAPPEGGVTAWYTMRLTALADGEEGAPPAADLESVVSAYDERDAARTGLWLERFSSRGEPE